MRRALLDLEDDKVRGAGMSIGKEGRPRLADKCIYPLMLREQLLLQRPGTQRPIRAHEGTVVDLH